MLSRDDELTVRHQAQLLGINRSAFYYKAIQPDATDLRIKRLIDEVHTKHPELGSRRIGQWLKQQYSLCINRKAVQRHMREMGIEAVYPRPNISKASPEHKIYPYLLKNLDITYPNQVWSIDITYIPIQKSYLYLVAIMDWYSRYVIGWEIDDTLDIRFVIDVCRNALVQSKPKIMNSDQGSHFTSPKYLNLFLDVGSKISMDHRGRAFDNIFIERLWRSVKYEDVYLKDYQCPRDARIGLAEYLHYYNTERPHQSLDYRTPADVYFGTGNL